MNDGLKKLASLVMIAVNDPRKSMLAAGFAVGLGQKSMGRIGVMDALNLRLWGDEFVELIELVGCRRTRDLVFGARKNPNPSVASVEVRVRGEFSGLGLSLIGLSENADVDFFWVLEADVLRALKITFRTIPNSARDARDTTNPVGVGDVQLHGHEGA